MTASESDSGTIFFPERCSAPRLADDLVPPHDERLEDLLQGQQDVMNLVLGGADLSGRAGRLVLVIEQPLRLRAAASRWSSAKPAA